MAPRSHRRDVGSFHGPLRSAGLISLAVLGGCGSATPGLPAGLGGSAEPGIGGPPGGLISGGETDRPALIVNMSVDQLRPDLLDHYDPLFTGGLRRLKDHGLHHPNGTHDHAYTGTAVGHATLATGVHPTRSGLVGNTWYEEVAPGDWQLVYAVNDPLSPIPGHPARPGRSPENLYRGGLPDWLMEHSPGSRVVSVSAKDRGAIPMAGRVRGEVYWMLPEEGEIVTSAWYGEAVPEWVARFNRERMPVLFGDTVWASTIPPEAGPLLRREDAAPYEGDGVHTTFPHRASEEATGSGGQARQYNRWRGRTPAVDRVTLELAMEAVRELELGGRGPIDYLAVSLSAVDYVGHDYGPWSHEQLDNLLRLDRELGAFFDHLDRMVGEGRWLLAFSADHGIVEVPESRAALEVGGAGRVSRTEELEARTLVAAAMEEGGTREEISERAAAVLRDAVAYIEAAMPLHLLEGGLPSDSFGDLFRNSFSRTRVVGPFHEAGVVVRMKEGAIVGRARGTTHTSPYLYDRWVPISFMGAGVEPGTSPERAATVDVAPTLAALAGIPAPADLDGRALLPR